MRTIKGALSSWPGAFGVFFVISSFLTLSWWRGMVPFPLLGGDAGNVASYAAAWLEPEAFAGDDALGDAGNFRFYATVHVPVLIFLEKIFGDFGTAFVALLWVTMLIQSMGFYRLGSVVFESGLGAWLLGLLSFGTVPLTIDYWGTYHDAQPRFVFGAVFPYLLASAIGWAREPDKWPRLFVAHGLASYIHPVSGPSVALASWLMLAMRGPGHTPAFPWSIRLLKAGVAYLIVFLPFALNYLTSREYGQTGDLETMLATYAGLFGREYIDGLFYVQRIMSAWQTWILAAWGAAGATAVWWLSPERGAQVRLLVLWLGGVVIASLGVTLAEQALSRALGALPPEIDTIRNVRYVFPVLLVCGLWGTMAVARKTLPSPFAAMAISFVAFAWLAANKPGVIPARETAACLMKGRVLCPPQEWIERQIVLEWLRREAPRGAKILPALDRYRTAIEISLALRYHARLPVVFSYKDGGSTLGYGNHTALPQWARILRRLENAYETHDTNAIFTLAEELDAILVLTDFALPSSSPPSWRQVLVQGNYVVWVRSAT